MTRRPAAIIKICGVTRLDDAREAERLGANAIGFNFYPASPRFIEPGEAARLAQSLPRVIKVGVFVNEDPERMLRICRETGMDIAQLHGGEAHAEMAFWRACRVQPNGDFDLPADGSEALLLDTASAAAPGGTGTTFPWRAARRAAGRPVIVAGGLDGTNVRRAIGEAQPWGVDACSRIESSPGRKDHQKMRDFIEAARAEFSL